MLAINTRTCLQPASQSQSSNSIHAPIASLILPTRLFEDDAHSVVEIRTDSLSTLRELGPPDLVHLIKQPVKSVNKQVILAPGEGSRV